MNGCEASRNHEREAVVRWLRSEAERISKKGERAWTRPEARDCGMIASAFYMAAQDIERERHTK